MKIRRFDIDGGAPKKDQAAGIASVGRHDLGRRRSRSRGECRQTEDAIAEVVAGAEEEVVAEVVDFGLEYGAQARADHKLFVDAFRNGRIEDVGPLEGSRN